MLLIIYLKASGKARIVIKTTARALSRIVLFFLNPKKEEYTRAQAFIVYYSTMLKIFQISKIGIISVKCLISYIDSVILGNAIPSGIDAKVRTIYESARKNSEFFPELCFLWTKE